MGNSSEPCAGLHTSLSPAPKINTDYVSWKEGQYLGLQEICREFHQEKREVWLMYGFGMWILWLIWNVSLGHWGCVLTSQTVETVWEPLGIMDLCLARLGATELCGAWDLRIGDMSARGGQLSHRGQFGHVLAPVSRALFRKCGVAWLCPSNCLQLNQLGSFGSREQV